MQFLQGVSCTFTQKSPDATAPNSTIIYKSMRSFWATVPHRRNDAKKGRYLLGNHWFDLHH